MPVFSGTMFINTGFMRFLMSKYIELQSQDLEYIKQVDCGLCGLGDRDIQEFAKRHNIIKDQARDLVRFWIQVLFIIPQVCGVVTTPYYCDSGRYLHQYISDRDLVAGMLELAEQYEDLRTILLDILNTEDLSQFRYIDLGNEYIRKLLLISKDLLRLLSKTSVKNVSAKLTEAGDTVELEYTVTRPQCPIEVTECS
jgi:hypothetical protein